MKTVKVDITSEVLARYTRKCDVALAAGGLVPMPSRFESLALKGIPVIVTERVKV
jgi:hypothetical protein